VAKKLFTHSGILSGDARQGNRQYRTALRKTPSGSHWVDRKGRKYRITGGGYAGDKWPMWHLHADTITELPEPIE
jgi:hypothetical protein